MFGAVANRPYRARGKYRITDLFSETSFLYGRGWLISLSRYEPLVETWIFPTHCSGETDVRFVFLVEFVKHYHLPSPPFIKDSEVNAFYYTLPIPALSIQSNRHCILLHRIAHWLSSPVNLCRFLPQVDIQFRRL